VNSGVGYAGLPKVISLDRGEQATAARAARNLFSMPPPSTVRTGPPPLMKGVNHQGGGS
jgi:hypothetical protein